MPPSDIRYLVWSHEHGGWWGRRGSPFGGYVASLAEAARYTREQALDICARAIPGTASRLGALPELPVREHDAEAIQDAYRGEYSQAAPEAWE